MDKIKLGYAPTRRSIFSAPDAVKYRGLTAKRLEELGIDFVDITDINEEGLLYDDKGLNKIIEKFKREKIDGLFLPHCNFGTEFECARLAKEQMCIRDRPYIAWCLYAAVLNFGAYIIVGFEAHGYSIWEMLVIVEI